MDPRIYYILPFFLASASILTVGVFTFFRYRTREGWYLVWICLSAAWWSLCEGLLYFGHDAETNMVVTQFQYFGIVATPPFTLLFTALISGHKDWISPKRTILLFVIPVVSLVLAWTNPFHQLIWSDYWTIDGGPFPMLGLEHGPFFWIMTAYIYSLLLVVTIVMLRQSIASDGLHRSQALIVLISIMMVWLLNAIYIFGQSPIANVDFSSIGFSMVAGAMAWGFFRFSLLDVIPVAKTEIFRSLSDGVLVLDHQNRIIDMNPAAVDLFGLRYSEAIGREAWDLFQDRSELACCLKNKTPGEVTLRRNLEEITYDIRLSPLKDHKDRPLGVVVVLRDISQRKRLEEKLERLAMIDPLTEIYNRRHFFKKAQLELLRAQRYRHPLSLLMIDIDHFKKINDCFGHFAGDDVLKTMTATSLENLRETDLFGRIGGEEFAVLLPETDSSQAWLVAERLRKSMDKIKLENQGEPVAFTVSIGLSSLNGEHTSVEQLLQRADKALYQAKSSGRNRVSIYEKQPIALV